MYWQKRFTREDPDLAIKIETEEIRKTNPNYGYRRLLPLLKLKGIVINKKKDRKSTRLNSSPQNLVCRLLLEKKKIEYRKK